MSRLRRPDLAAWLGKSVHVVIDRPHGSRHPIHPELIYRLNYGFVPNTLSGDGDEIDAYVLGVEYPLGTFDGRVVAIVIREDDDEDKLVVADASSAPALDEIQAAIHFQERYFRSAIIM